MALLVDESTTTLEERTDEPSTISTNERTNEFILGTPTNESNQSPHLQLDKYVHAGTDVVILAAVPLAEREALMNEGKARKLELRNLALHHVQGSTILRRDLEAV